ncbi:MAG: acetate kinase [Planctomycetota bacterium]|nr:MAG: acetate kinase [Planctomycetota bacterium]REJ95161.1 MAG: acetate kinase [Planctomycetota bacterium]REK23808.1 MAG: acetate kinase [Planctomycetota bacterium]REK32885.1 MAG: acetate kinase [Planctomycetota bacterium]
MTILLLNAGSSSLKCTLMQERDGTVVASARADWAGSVTRYEYTGPDGQKHAEEVPWRKHADAVRRALNDLENVAPAALPQATDLAAVGHRVVHGGPFTSAMRLTPEVRARISELTELAPLHNPPSLETISAAEAVLPDVPHVAVFDTSFHATLPREAATYPLPRKWTEEWGIRRYGFHGLSHAYCAARAAEMLDQPAESLRLVICHLGHGCSASAVHGGRCVDTTMGFTPLDGLMMATRSGAVDPGAIVHVQRRFGLTAEEVETALNQESGLLGVSGVSADMRLVLQAADEGNERAQLAVSVYTHRVRQAVGALSATLGGVDALVFTAGVGEHSAAVRADICGGLECLGLQLDAARNSACSPDADIAHDDSPGRILIVTSREDVMMLKEVLGVLGQAGPG